MESRQITETDLAQFTGTTQYFRHWTRKIVFTDGVQFLAEQAGAYWLVDLIASYQPLCDSRQYWTLTIDGGLYSAVCKDRDDCVLVSQTIEYSDFPANLLPFTLYLQDGVLFLPSED